MTGSGDGTRHAAHKPVSSVAMLSVVIAVRNEEEGLARTLACLVPGVAEGVLRDAVILDAGDSEAMAAIADAAGCKHVRGQAQDHLALAADHAHSDWMLMLRPGVTLEHDWFREAAEFVERAGASGQADVCAAFTYASQRYGAGARLREAWRFLAANLMGQVVASQGLIVRSEIIRRIAAGKPGSPGVPPKPPSGCRVTVLRARAYVP